MYIYHKESDYRAFTSLRALSDYTRINYDTLTYQFSRNGAKQYFRDGAVITKTVAISKKRS